MIETVATFFEEYHLVLGMLAGFSAVMFFASILSLPFLVSFIPTDYFQYAAPYIAHHTFKHPVIRLSIIITKNILGWSLLITGTILLILPGQGLITMIAGLILINFPGKRKIERKLVSNHRVLHVINWLRSKRKKEPLVAPE
jgi:hypothetical protein